MIIRLSTALFVLAASAICVSAQEPRSIVGTWTASGEACTPAAGAIRIAPMGMVSEDVNCRFGSVRRDGATVTWTGMCDSAEGSTRQTVIATERNGRLTIRYQPGGNMIDNLVRCRAR